MAENNKRSGISLPGILLIIAIIAIGVLIYVLVTTPGKTITETSPVNAPGPQLPIGSPESTDFNDGLGTPNNKTEYQLDEFGAGIARVEIFNIDINGDNKKDVITRTRIENGTDHFYFDYKIELSANDKLVNITPDGFRTVESAECALQKLRFAFKPKFEVIKISREWEESWSTPTYATRTSYELIGNELRAKSSARLKQICNVSDLF